MTPFATSNARRRAARSHHAMKMISASIRAAAPLRTKPARGAPAVVGGPATRISRQLGSSGTRRRLRGRLVCPAVLHAALGLTLGDLHLLALGTVQEHVLLRPTHE